MVFGTLADEELRGEVAQKADVGLGLARGELVLVEVRVILEEDGVAVAAKVGVLVVHEQENALLEDELHFEIEEAMHVFEDLVKQDAALGKELEPLHKDMEVALVGSESEDLLIVDVF